MVHVVGPGSHKVLSLQVREGGRAGREEVGGVRLEQSRAASGATLLASKVE